MNIECLSKVINRILQCLRLVTTHSCPKLCETKCIQKFIFQERTASLHQPYTFHLINSIGKVIIDTCPRAMSKLGED